MRSSGTLEIVAQPKRVLLLGYDRPLTAVRLPQLFGEAGHRVDAVYPNGFSVGESRYLNTCYWTDSKEGSYLSVLQGVLEKNEYDLCILSDEKVLRILSDEVGHVCIKRLGNLPLDSLRLQSLFDKASFTEFGQSEKWPLPESKIFDNSPQAIEYGRNTVKYPFVVKGATGAGGWSVQIFKSDEDLKSIKSSLNSGGRCVVQRYIIGDVGTVEALYHRGELLAFISSMKYRNRGGETSPSASRKLLYHAQLQPIAEQVGRALGYTGFFGFDFMHESQSNDIKVIELHGRAASSYNLGKRIGVDFAKIVSGIGGDSVDCVSVAPSHSGELYSVYPQYFKFLKDLPFKRRVLTFFQDLPLPWNRKFYNFPDFKDRQIYKSYFENQK